MTRRAPTISREPADRDGCRRSVVHYHESTRADERVNGDVFPGAAVVVRAWRNPRHETPILEIKPERGGPLTPGKPGEAPIVHVWTDETTALLALVLCEETNRESIEVRAYPTVDDPLEIVPEATPNRAEVCAEMHVAEARGNLWGWGRVGVTVRALGFEASSTLVYVDRAYRDADHFRQPGGLFDRCLREAIGRLAARIRGRAITT